MARVYKYLLKIKANACLLNLSKNLSLSLSLHQTDIYGFQDYQELQKVQYYDADPTTPRYDKTPEWKSAAAAMTKIKSGDNVYVHGFAATPTLLLNSLCKHALENKLKNVTLHHLLLEGKAEWFKDKYRGILKSNSLFISENTRRAANNGKADAMSIFLSEVPWLFRKNIIRLDVALIHVSTPDKHGFCTLGPSVECTRSAVMNAKHIIAVFNPKMPRTFGDGVIHASYIDTMVFGNTDLYKVERTPPTKTERKIGRLIAEELVENGATLQIGIGAIPNAVVASLRNHQDLGIHTEVLSDGILELVKCGAVTNSRKNIHPGKIVTSTVFGSSDLYDFLNDNPMIMMGDIGWVNDSAIINQNPKVTALNSATQVDITGQVVADSIGTKFISGFGGQVDFIRAASQSEDGKGRPIIALASATKDGKKSKIVPYIDDGSGVVTTRAHVHYVVTEHGIAELFGRSMRHRAFELIRIAHPEHREWLERAAYGRLKCMPARDDD